MEYHIFKKKSNKNGKIKWSWYYWYWNADHTKQVQKACKGCKSKHEAESMRLSFISSSYIRRLKSVL